MSDTPSPSLLSEERLAEMPRPLPYKQRMSLTQDALAGLPEHTNSPARFQGQSGYWVQGDAIFVPCSNPGTAITYYRQRFNSGDIAASHNLATAAVGRMNAAAALDDFRQAVAEQLRGQLLPMGSYEGSADGYNEMNHARRQNTAIQAIAAALSIDLTT